MISDDALDALKARNPVHAVAGEYVKLRRKGRGYVGPCPICSNDPRSRTAQRFECDSDKWMCAVCHGGGDVIKLVRLREGLAFQAAVDRLGGAREEKPTPELAKRAGRRAFKAGGPMGEVPAPYNTDDALRVAWCDGWSAGRKAEQYEIFARKRERDRLLWFWDNGKHWRGTPLAAYFARRELMRPSNAQLRFHPDMPLFCDGKEIEPLLAHRGPAMLAAIFDAGGQFIGLHTTWLDPSGPNGKALVHHPLTGEVLPSKKVRGTKAGGFIDLGGCAVEAAKRMIAGEGVETVLAAFTALVRAGRDVTGTLLRCSVDLGNLAGKATETLAHPTLKTEAGRPQRVPGPVPDLDSPAMPVPDSVPELVLLGDGDSDPFLTRNALERSRARHRRDNRIVRAVFPDEATSP